MTTQATPDTGSYDVVVLGAGIAGIYSVYKFRDQGLSVKAFDSASDVGGVWFWNRYPGARCDVESIDYSYSFDPALEQEWDWTEKYATQPEILAYLQHVTDRYDLRKHMQFDTRITSAELNEENLTWTIRTDQGDEVTARFFVIGAGPLSNANVPAFPGLGDFRGDILHTAQWPHEGYDFTGKKVGLIGTGSSGIQAAPELARDAEKLYVFQRTANYSIPAGNRPITEEGLKEYKANYAERRALSWTSGGGSPHRAHEQSALAVSEEERERAYEERWKLGGVLFSKTFPDQLSDLAANDTARVFWEKKIRAVIDDPEVAEQLIPNDHPIGAKRICTDSNYYETFNRDNVELVNLRRTPLEGMDATGINTSDAHYDLDVIVLATGFDAMTGSVSKVDIVGRAGQSLNEAWAEGPKTYVGLGVNGFPNMFNLTGPGSPSVLANMVLHSELHVNFVAELIKYLDEKGAAGVEASAEGQEAWVDQTRKLAEGSLLNSANSWYLGSNIPNRPRVFMPYAAGFSAYREILEEISGSDYRGFTILEN